MKTEHVLILVLVLVVALMVRNPKKTTAQITTGEHAAIDIGGAVIGGVLTPPKRAR